MPLLGQVKLSESTRLLLTESHRARDRVNVEEGAADKWPQIQNKKGAKKWRVKQPIRHLKKITFFIHCWNQDCLSLLESIRPNMHWGRCGRRLSISYFSERVAYSGERSKVFLTFS